MNNYKRYLKETIIFILGELNFCLYHLKLLNLKDEYQTRIIVIENEINNLLSEMNNNEIFKGDDKK